MVPCGVNVLFPEKEVIRSRRRVSVLALVAMNDALRCELKIT
jgi:hypothetical protein